jgi:hypothetical protein
MCAAGAAAGRVEDSVVSRAAAPARYGRGWRAAWIVTSAIVACVTSMTCPSEAALTGVKLDVPVVQQTPEHCGPAALHMVLAFHHADSATCAAADSAYDPVLRGSLVTDLAARARRSGFAARIAVGGADSLVAWLEQGIPPIVLYPRGIGPLSRQHYAVVTGWDPNRNTFSLNDGGPAPRSVSRPKLERWRAVSDRRVLLVMPSP